MRGLAAVGLILLVAGCARPHLQLPVDPGSPLSDAAAIHQAVSAACAPVRTLTGEFSLAGRTGTQRMRGRVIAGLARPSSIRLEGVAPFGPPVFVLTAGADGAVLVLPRDHRVVRAAAAGAILEAITGLAWEPADLLAVLTGCVESDPVVVSGLQHRGGWASLQLRGGSRLWVERVGRGWQVRAASRDRWRIEYDQWTTTFPARIAIRSTSDPVVDLVVTVAQSETNMDVDAAAFRAVVPEDAMPMSLDALREAGPLGEPAR